MHRIMSIYSVTTETNVVTFLICCLLRPTFEQILVDKWGLGTSLMNIYKVMPFNVLWVNDSKITF